MSWLAALAAWRPGCSLHPGGGAQRPYYRVRRGCGRDRLREHVGRRLAPHALLDNLVTVKSFAVDVLLDYEGDKTRAEGVFEIAFRNLFSL